MTTACRTTQHCAHHGFCHRCQPEFAATMSKVNVAIQRNDPNEDHWGPLYEAIGKALLPAALPPADRAPSRRAGLRNEIAAALEAADYRMDMRRGDLADAVLPVLYREWPWLRAEAEDAAVLPAPVDRAAAEPPLSPDYQHPACGFHWHGRDGMDIPMRDGQPVCPRCELAAAERWLRHSEKRREELRAESRRRGTVKLEYAEKIRHLEKQLDEVRTQLGAEILRAGQAEDELRRLVAEATPEPAAEDRPVAYRSYGTRALYCVICARQEDRCEPATQVDEKAVCSFCGGNLLAVSSRTLGGVIAKYLEEAP